MTKKMDTDERISKQIELPSPMLQKYLREIVLDDEAHMVFLEDTQRSLSTHGMDLDPDVSGDLLVEFRFAISRARELLKKKKSRLRFEDVFSIPTLAMDNTAIRFKPKKALRDTTVDVFYSENTREENRGRETKFENDREVVTRKETSSWHVREFGGTSLFPFEYRTERFMRTPLLSANTLRKIIQSINFKAKGR